MKNLFFKSCFLTLLLSGLTFLYSYGQVTVTYNTYDPVCSDQEVTIRIAEEAIGAGFGDLVGPSPGFNPQTQYYTIGFSNTNFEFVVPNAAVTFPSSLTVTYKRASGTAATVDVTPLSHGDIIPTQFSFSYTMKNSAGDQGYFEIKGLKVRSVSSSGWTDMKRLTGVTAPTPLAIQTGNGGGDNQIHAKLKSGSAPPKPTVNAPTEQCIDNVGHGHWDFTLGSGQYKPSQYDYELQMNITGWGKVDLDLEGDPFRNPVDDGNAFNVTRTYRLKVMSNTNNGCYVYTDDIPVTFRSNKIKEKGTETAPTYKLLKYSDGPYQLTNSDIFSGLNFGLNEDDPPASIDWTINFPATYPAGGITFTGGKWVIDPTKFASGSYINYNEITYTAIANGCEVSGILAHTKFQFFNDKATLPLFLRPLGEMPICENAGTSGLYASVNPECFGTSAVFPIIFVTATYYDSTTKVTTNVPIKADYSGKDPFSTNSLYVFWIDPGKHKNNSIPIKIEGLGAMCPSSLYKGDIPIFPKNTPGLYGLPPSVKNGISDYIHLCSASSDTIEMRANPANGTYSISLVNPSLTFIESISEVELAYPTFGLPKEDGSLIKFIPSDIFKRIIPTGSNSLIRVLYTSPPPCPTVIERFFIFDTPVGTAFNSSSSIRHDTICYGDTLHLAVTPLNNLGSKFLWDFGDGTNSGFMIDDTLKKHLYQKPGMYKLRFKTLLNSTSIPTGMCNNDVVDTIWVGAKPNADFEVARNFEDVKARFHSTAKITLANFSDATDVVNKWQWVFDKPELITSTSVDTFNIFTNYLKDPYKILHIATSKWGCVDTSKKHIPVFPINEVTIDKFSLDTFGIEDVNGWYQSGQYKLDTLSSWENLKPKGNKIKGNSDAWMTWKNDKKKARYYNNEKSYVESPVYDISDLSLPMVSLNTWINADNLCDGASLQYAFCDSVAFGKEQWHTLGEVDKGLDWYNSQSVLGMPGGDYRAWTSDTSSSWKLSAFRMTDLLDSMKAPKKHKLFRFRFVIGTNPDNNLTKDFDGFAFDNFFVGQRNRKILVEEFCDIVHFEPLMKVKMVDPQAVRIQYHVRNMISNDDINNANRAEPSARALHYGVDRVPVGVIDGMANNLTAEFLPKGEDAFFKRSLIQAPFDITINSMPDVSSKLLKVTATVTKNTNVPIAGPFLVHIAILEKEVVSNGLTTPFTNVLRNMLPNAAGQRIDINWNKNHTEEFHGEWTPFVIPKSKLYVVAYIQDDITKEVYQVNLDSIELSTAEKLFKETPSSLKQSAFNDVILYPNPTNSTLNILLNGITSIENQYRIIDALGNTILTGQIEKNINLSSIDVSSLSNGLYHFNIDTGEFIVSKNFFFIK
jgi:hypothetical protein